MPARRNHLPAREPLPPPGPGEPLHHLLRSAPPRSRPALEALHRLRRECLSVPLECREPHIASARLRFWRQELERAGGGRPTHPLGAALAATVAGRRRADAGLTRLLDAADDLLALRQPPAAAALEALAARIGRTSADPVVLHPDLDPGPFEDAIGTVWAGIVLAEWLADLGGYVRHGCWPVAREDLGPTSGSPGPPAPGDIRWKAAVAAAATRARHRIAEGLVCLPRPCPPPLRPTVVAAGITLALLRAVAREGTRIHTRRCHLTPLRMVWVARRWASGPPARALRRR